MMKSVRNSWMIGVAAATLLVACGDNADDGESRVERKASEIARNAEAEMKKIDVREGDATKAADALAAMAFDSSDSGMLSFGASDVDGAAATFENVSWAIPDEDDASINMGKVEFEGLDMSDAGANFARMTVTDIVIVPPEDDRDDGSLEIASVELINPSPELAAFVASLGGANGEPGEFPSFDQITFDAFSLNGLNFKLNEGDEDVSIDFGDVKILGFSGERVELFQLADIDMDIYDSYDDKRMKFAIGNFAIEGADKKTIDTMMQAAQSGDDEEAMMQAIMQTAYGDPTDPGFDGFAMADISFDGDGVNFALPKMDAVVDRNKDGKVTRYETFPFTATLKADPEAGEMGAELAGALAMLQYEEIEISGESLTVYDPENDTSEIKSNRISLKDGFDLNFTGKFGGLESYGAALATMDMDAMQNDPEAMMQAFSQLTLYDVEMTLKDDSIVDRLFNLAATQSGDDPQSLRNQAVAMTSMAPMMAAQSGVDPEIATEVASAIADFLKEPGTLTIKMDPNDPIGANTFSSPEEITKKALGLSVTAK
jgi:hypothetical protein